MQQGFSMPSSNFAMQPVKFSGNNNNQNNGNNNNQNTNTVNSDSWLQMFNPFNYSITGGNTTMNMVPDYSKVFSSDKNNGIALQYGYGGNNNNVGVTNWNVYNYAQQNGIINNKTSYQDFMNDEDLYTSTVNTLKADAIGKYGDKLTGIQQQLQTTGTQGNWMTGLENIQNIANVGLGALSAYANWDSYKMNKNLAQKNIALLEQQIEQNRENMENTRQERARRDKMRSNAQSQRASTSSIRG